MRKEANMPKNTISVMAAIALSCFGLFMVFIAIVDSHNHKVRQHHARLTERCYNQGGTLVHVIGQEQIDVCVNIDNIIFTDSTGP